MSRKVRSNGAAGGKCKAAATACATPEHVRNEEDVSTPVLQQTMALWCMQHFHPNLQRVRANDCHVRDATRARLVSVIQNVLTVRRRPTAVVRGTVEADVGGQSDRTLAAALRALGGGREQHTNDDAQPALSAEASVDVTEVELNAVHCATVIEQILFWRWYYRRPAIYRQRCRELEYNLSVNGYYLLTRFGPDLLCTLPSRKLAEHTTMGEWRTDYRQRVLRDLKPPTPDELPHGMFRCPRCRKDHTTYYEMQTRSADEPTTKFVTCLNPGCGITFKRE